MRAAMPFFGNITGSNGEMTNTLRLLAQAVMIEPRLFVALIGLGIVTIIAATMGASILEGPRV